MSRKSVAYKAWGVCFKIRLKEKRVADENTALFHENLNLKHEIDEHKMAFFGLKRKFELLEYKISILKEGDCSIKMTSLS